MDVKIWPRRINDKGGFACMPLQKNVLEGHSGWKLAECPECGRKCWETPALEFVKNQGVTALCTECALKKGLIGGNV